MAQATTLELLPQTAFSGLSTITGNAVPAAAYYLGYQDLQTLSWSVGPGISDSFTGDIILQASLVDTPTDADWFVVFNLPLVNSIQNSYTNIQGNFIWLRVVVNGFLKGVIRTIKISY
jgi:hypothetical protein